MMKTCYYAGIAVLVSTLFSCSREKTVRHAPSHRIDSVELVATGRKAFLLDSSTSYQTLFMTVYRNPADKKRYLAYENRLKQSVQFYDFETGHLWKELRYQREGPDGVGKIRGFYIQSLDSIYLMSSKYYQFILVDGFGRVKRRYRLIKKDTHIDDWSLPAIYTSTPAILKDGVFHFVAFPESNPIEKGKPALTLNLADSSCNLIYQFPDFYQEKHKWGTLLFNLSVTKNSKGAFLYCFAGDPYLYETTDHRTEKIYFAGSRHFNKTESWDKDQGFGSEESYVQSDYYKGILYDPFRHVYYRFAHLKLPALNTRNERNDIWNKPMSIIILDKNFRIVGETLLEANRYDFRNWLTVEEGLLICNSNPHNPELEEGKLKFTLFSLQKITAQ